MKAILTRTSSGWSLDSDKPLYEGAVLVKDILCEYRFKKGQTLENIKASDWDRYSLEALTDVHVIDDQVIGYLHYDAWTLEIPDFVEFVNNLGGGEIIVSKTNLIGYDVNIEFYDDWRE